MRARFGGASMDVMDRMDKMDGIDKGERMTWVPDRRNVVG